MYPKVQGQNQSWWNLNTRAIERRWLELVDDHETFATWILNLVRATRRIVHV